MPKIYKKLALIFMAILLIIKTNIKDILLLLK